MAGENLLDWHDREIRFDIPLDALELRRGEFIIDSLEPVEDTKGNNGESGTLQITNLRMMWISTSDMKTNLSIGYTAVVNIHIRAASSRLKGNTEALYVLTKTKNSRFEFIFTNLVRDTPRLFTTVQAVFRSVPVSASIFQDSVLSFLPQHCSSKLAPSTSSRSRCHL